MSRIDPLADFDVACPPRSEVVPGLTAARQDRWTNALAAVAIAADLEMGRSRQAYRAYERGARRIQAAQFIAQTLNVICSMGPLYSRPGAAAFCGVARAEFALPAWQELPPGEGTPVITIPILQSDVFKTETPILVAIDVIAV